MIKINLFKNVLEKLQALKVENYIKITIVNRKRVCTDENIAQNYYYFTTLTLQTVANDKK